MRFGEDPTAAIRAALTTSQNRPLLQAFVAADRPYSSDRACSQPSERVSSPLARPPCRPLPEPENLTQSDLVKTVSDQLCPNPQRTVLRPFRVTAPENEGVADGRTARIIKRVLAIDPHERKTDLRALISTLERRHDNVAEMLDQRFAELQDRFGNRLHVDEDQRRLVAAFLTEEYSVEAAALFNPSAVPHFDQSGLAKGDTRFIMSLRGIGEGHVSSVLFQTATWHADGSLTLDARGPRALGPDVTLPTEGSDKRTAELDFPDGPIGERVIYPFLPSQGRGLEDARFCIFTDEDGSSFYRGTFTAFDGQQSRQAVVRTEDFRHMVARRLDGDLAFTKGAAWFPRRIDGRYAMLGRLDEESIFLFRSDDPDEWNGGEPIIAPCFGWEAVQMGNCGSPIEIDEGWLVLTHGVGQARTYCMGAALLDRDDPSKVLARTPAPILQPSDDDQGGYVPNIVYSCGGFVRGRTLLLPYGVADNFTAIGTVDLDDLLGVMR